MKPRQCLLLFCLVLLNACSQQPSFKLSDLPAFEQQPLIITSNDAAQYVEDIPLRQLSKTTTNYFEQYLVPNMHSRQVAIQLRNLIKSPAFLDFDYAENKTISAQQAFDQTQGNCLGYSHLYLALARHFGLKAHYQLVESDPTLVLIGNKISLAIHVNVVVQLPDGSTFTADTVPSKQHLVKRGTIISDATADALHYNNLAVDALKSGDYVNAYRHLAKAISLDSNLSLLWSNVGALYRKNQQAKAAEQSLHTALALDAGAYAALNNLAVLYQHQHDEARSRYYINRIKTYKARNPYHQYNSALLEIYKQNYPLALKLLNKAIDLKDDEPEFYYQQSLTFQRLNKLEQSQFALTEAINLSNDPRRKRQFLEQQAELQQEQNLENSLE